MRDNVKTITQMGEMTTFAQLIKEIDPKVLRTPFKIPPWLLGQRERKDQAKLTVTEQERFLCAFDMLNQSGQLGQFVAIHGNMIHRQHGTLRFLPWHRVFLFLVENALETFHPDVTIPYWNWTKEQQIPPWLQNYKPLVSTPTGNIQVIRSPGSQQDLANDVSTIPEIMNAVDFPHFSMTNLGGIEAPHNLLHVWVGGTMSFISTAPADPIFFMHHANIDRLWWNWQNGAGKGINPALIGMDSIMDPWAFTESDTRDITKLPLGYKYV